MRNLLVVIGTFLALLSPALAAPPVFDTPKALLDYAYAPYATGKFKDDSSLLYSKPLEALFAAAEANTPEDDVGPVDFDVFVNGQDYQLTDLQIGDPVPEATGVSVPVSLKNFGDVQSLVFHLVEEGGGWKIGDIESLTSGSSWRLTTLLTPDDSSAPDDSSDSSPAGAADGDNSAADSSGTNSTPAN